MQFVYETVECLHVNMHAHTIWNEHAMQSHTNTEILISVYWENWKKMHEIDHFNYSKGHMNVPSV